MSCFENYLISVGIRSHEYTYSDEILFIYIDYFKDCYDRGISPYSALVFFHEFLTEEK